MKKQTGTAHAPVWKRLLSVLLCAVMVLPMFNVGLVPLTSWLGSLTVDADAASVKAASTASGDLTFIVPEVIYLTPNATAWKDATTSTFQYYVNNTSSNATIAAYETTGKIYYTFSGASTATLSYQFYDESLSSTLIGSATLSSDSISSGGFVNITGGTSPSLAAATNGCYIQWCLSYTDTADNVEKKAYAYTYVYKPYTVPVGTMARLEFSYEYLARTGFNQSIAFMSGFHSATASDSSSASGLYYPYYTGEYSLAVFSSRGTAYRIGSTTGSSSSRSAYATGATTYSGNTNTFHAKAYNNYLLFAGTGTGTYHFTTNPSNKGATAFGSTTNNSSSTYPIPFTYQNGEQINEEQNDATWATSKYHAKITIDTSRYSDLSEIPNLSIGLLVTDDQRTESGGSWYVADSTGKTTQGCGTQSDSSSSLSNLLDSYNYIIAGAFTGRTDLSWSETEGVRYAGAWAKEIDKSVTSKTYAIHCANGSKRSSCYGYTIHEISLDATQYNKTSLRTAVQNATKAMAKMGVNGASSGSLTSCYFDADSSYAWTTFQSAYKDAVIGLTKLNSTENPDTLAAALNNAMDGLQTKVTIQDNSGVIASSSTYIDVGITTGVNTSVSYTPAATGSRFGYTLTWSTNASATSGSATVTVGYNNTVYAIWVPLTYRIVYNGNGATTGSMEDTVASYDGPVTLTTNAFTRAYTVTYEYNGATGGNSTQNATSTATFNGWEDRGDIVYANGTTYSYTTFDAPYYANTYGDLYNAFGYNKYDLLSHYINNGQGESRSCKGDAPGLYPNGATVKNLSTTNNAEVNLYANWTVPGITLPTPTKTGYTFGGWYSDSGLTNRVGGGGENYTPTASGMLYAKWTANKYYLDLNGLLDGEGSGNISGYGTADVYINGTLVADDVADFYSQYDYGTSYEIMDIKTATGHTYLNVSVGSLTGTIPDSNVNVQLQFKTNTYDIAFDANGGTGTTAGISGVKYGETKTLTANGFSRNGYAFLGWSTSSGATAATYTDGQSVSNLSTDDGATVTLYAVWSTNSYTLTLNENGGSSVDDINYVTTDTKTLPTPTKSGSTFAGWKVTTAGGSWELNKTYSNGTSVQNKYGNATLTAQWTANKYSVLFDACNPDVKNNLLAVPTGSSTKSGVTYSYDKETGTITLNGTLTAEAQYAYIPFTVTSGKTYTLSSTYVSGTKGGDVFVFEPVTNTSGTAPTSGRKNCDTATSNTSKTFTATAADASEIKYIRIRVWYNSSSTSGHTFTNFKVKIKVAESSTVTGYTPNGYYMSYNTAYGTLPTVTRDGYTFEGWYTAASGGTEVTSTTKMTQTSTQTLYAHWSPVSYDITYNANGGSMQDGETGTQSYTATDAVTLRTPKARDGYDFAGWTPSKTSGYTGSYNWSDSGLTGAQTAGKYGNVTMTAQWTPHTYTIIYNKNATDASGNTTSSSHTYGVAKNLTKNDFTRTGYTFRGWSTNSGATTATYTDEQSVTSLTATAGGTVNLYAVWQANQVGYKVYYYQQNITDDNYTLVTADTVTNTTAAADSTVTLSALKKSYTGFDFENIKIDGTVTTAATATVKPNGSLEIYVYYTRHEYTLTVAYETGTSGVSTTATYRFGTPVSVTATISAGWTWSQWTSNKTADVPNSTENPYSFDMPATDLTLTATATQNTSTLVVDANSGTWTGTTPRTENAGTAIDIPDPTRTGHSFSGWTLAKTGGGQANGSFNGTTKKYTFGNAAGASDTLTAGWTINQSKLIINPDGGTYGDTTANTTVTQNYNTTYTVADPVRAGYTFNGWTEGGSGGTWNSSTKVFTFGADAGVTKTLTANWTAVNQNYYIDVYTMDTSGVYPVTAVRTTKQAATDASVNYTDAVSDGFTLDTSHAGYSESGTIPATGDGLVLTIYLKRNRYALTLAKDSATVSQNGITGFTGANTYYYGAELTVTATLKSGYDFVNWKNGSTVVSTSASYTFNMPAGALTLTASASLHEYSIGYTLNGGTATGNPTTYTVTTDTFTLHNPTKDYYDFTGWTGSNGTTPSTSVSVEKGTTDNLSYTANWTPTDYDISYNLDGGAVTTNNPATYNYETAEFTLNNPTKTGYTFAGWTGTGLSAATETVTVPTHSNGARTYTATWTANKVGYSVEHYWQDLTGSTYTKHETVSGTAAADSSLTLNTLKKTYEGFTFSKFTVDDNEVTGDVTVKADGGLIVKVYYIRNGHTFTASSYGVADTVGTYRYGATLPSVTAGNKPGYAFSYWSPSIPSTMPDNDLTVEAVYVPAAVGYTVRYYQENANDSGYTEVTGDKVINTTAKTEDILTLADFNNKSYTGFTFQKYQVNGVDTSASTATVTADGNLAISVYYKRNTHAFTAISEGVTVASGTYKYGQTVPTVTDPTKTGYTFTGWDPAWPSAMPDNDLTVTAQFSSAAVNITVHHYLQNADNDGYTEEASTTTVQGIANTSYTLANAQRSINGFTYYYGTVGSGTTPETTVTAAADGSTVIHLYYTRITHTLTISYTGVVSPAITPAQKVLTLRYGQSYSEASPTVTGHTPDIATVSGTMELSNITQTVTYTPDRHKVTIHYIYEDGTKAHDDIVISNVAFGSTYAQLSPEITGYTPDVTTVSGTMGAADSEATVTYGVNQYGLTITYTYDGTDDPNRTAGSTADATYSLDYDYGATYSVTSPVITGYTASELTVSGTMGAGAVSKAVTYKINRYTVTYKYKDASGTEVSTQQTVSHGYDATIPTGLPTWTGHTFNHWDRANTNITGDTVINAVYDTNNYTITFDSKGGSNVSSITAAYGSDVTAPTDPTRSGYTFGGWYSDEELTTAYTFTTMPAQNITLYAKWNIVTYGITYDLKGGSVTTANPVSYNVETTSFTLNNPEKTGYTFAGWTGTGLSGRTMTVTVSVGSTGERSYTANWTAANAGYKVEHYLMNTDGTTYTLKETENKDADSDTAVVLTGHEKTYDGFTYNSTLTACADSTVRPDGNTTVCLYYTRNKYTVTWYTVTGTEFTHVTDYYDKAVSAPATDPTRTGYTFKAWNKTVSKIPLNGDSVIATWNTVSYTIIYNTNGGNTIENQGYNIEDDLTLATASRTGYTFAGWTVTATDSTANNWASTVTDNGAALGTGKYGNVTLTAGWTANAATYTVETYTMKLDGTYSETPDAAGEVRNSKTDTVITLTPTASEGFTSDTANSVLTGTVAYDNSLVLKIYYSRNKYKVTLNRGTGIASVSLNKTADAEGKFYFGTELTATKTMLAGYDWVNWTGDKATANESNTFTVTAGDITVTANGKLHNYTITVNTNGGTLGAAVPAAYTVVSDDITIGTPTKTGYTFNGWSGSASGQTVTIPKGSTGDKTFDANWQVIPYTITYTMNGGTNHSSNPTGYNVETEDFSLQDPTRTGYTFTGWTYDGQTTPTKTVTVTKGSTGNRAYTANWSANDVNYKVRHFYMNVSGTGYDMETEATDRTGKADSAITMTALQKGKTGFTFSVYKTGTTEITAATVSPDGKLVIDVYYTRNKYTVTLEKSVGVATVTLNKSADTEGKYYFGTELTASCTLSNGYDWDKWSGDFTAASFTVPAKNVTLKANAKIHTYTISYTMQDSTAYTAVNPAANKTGYVVTDSAFTLTEPTRRGYDFTGWTTDGVSAPDKSVTVNTADCADKTYYAHWTPHTYTIAYDLGGGSLASGVVNKTGYTVEQSDFTVSNPTKTGYVFEGWTGTDLSAATKTLTVDTDTCKDLSFTATWSEATNTPYKVIHKIEDLNADTYTVKDTDDLTGTTNASVTPAVKTYDGFTAPATQTVTIGADGLTTVTYLYTRNSYTVTYYYLNTTQHTVQTYEYEAAVSAPANPERTGYTFGGWGTALPGTMPAENITRTAVWNIVTYDINYTLNGGTNHASNPAAYDIEDAEITLQDPTRTGYTFTGWTYDGQTTPLKNPKIPAGSTGSRSFTANWNANAYTVTFHSGTDTDTQDFVYDTAQTLKTNGFTKTGYTFSGWAAAENGTVSYGDGQEVKNLTAEANGNVDLYAVWTANTYTVTFAKNVTDTSVTGTMADMTDRVYDEEFVLTENAFARTGYTFLGWSKNASAVTADYADKATVKNLATGGTVTLYAVWQANTYTVKYVGVDGVEGAAYGANHPTSYVYDTALPVSDPTRTGYTFSGWKINGVGSYKNLTLAAKTYTDTITLTATWEPNAKTYNIEYYFMTVDGTSYVLDTARKATETKNSVSDATVTADTTVTVTGFTYNATQSAATVSGTVPAGEETLTLKLYYDRNTYTLTWKGDGYTTRAETLYFEEGITYPTENLPHKTGYTFAGWDTHPTAMPANDLTLTAIFTGNKDTKYTVKHYLQNIGGGENYTLEYTDNLTGETATEVTPDVKTYTGFTSPAPQTVTIAADGTMNVDYKYTRNTHGVTVTATDEGLSAASAAGTAADKKYYYGDTVTVTVTVADGYTFTGWTITGVSGKTTSSDTTFTFTMPDGDVTLTANCTKDVYAITYLGTDGASFTTANPASYTVTDNTITLVNPTKTGWTFDGWSGTGISGMSKTVTIPKGSTGERTFTANWTHIEYSISYNLNNGTETAVNPTVYYIDSTDITLAAPTRPGYTFKGWSGTGLEGDSNLTVTIPTGSYDNRNYTANWTADLQTYYVDVYEMDTNGDYHSITSTPVTTAHTDETVTYTMVPGTGMSIDRTNSAQLDGDTDVLTGVIPATGTLRLSAYYSRNKYTLTLTKGTGIETLNIGDTTAVTQQVYYDASVTVHASAMSGYTWAKWTQTGTDTEKSVSASYTFNMPASALGLTANTTLDTYTINYTMNGGTVDGTNPAEFHVTDETFTLINPTKTGYTFTGWTGSNGSAPQLTVTIKKGSVGNRTYTANFTINSSSLTVDPNTGVWNGYTTAQSYTQNYNTTLDIPVPTKTGYTFTGWTLSDPFTGSMSGTGAADAVYTFGAPQGASSTITAQWTANTDTKYTVNHYKQNVTADGYETPETVEFEDGTSDATVTPAVKTYEGFTSPSVQTVKVNADGSTIVNYYYTRNTYTVTFVAEGSADIVRTYYYDAAVTAPADPTRTGYTFRQWDAVVVAKMPASDLTYTAEWDLVPYTVTFDVNNGNALTDFGYNIETAVTLPEAKRTGYEFVKWTVTGTGTNWEAEITENSKAFAAGLYGNVTLTAVWKARDDIDYAVNYMLMDLDGTNYTASTDSYAAQGTADTTVTPVVIDYAGFTSPAAQTVNIDPAGTTVINFYYTRNKYTIVYNTKGGTPVDSVTAFYGAAVTAPADPTRTGYTFGGWDQTIPAAMPVGGLTINAQWNVITYTITYDLADSRATVTANPDSYTVETETFTLHNPSLTGFTFLGWTGTNGITPETEVTVTKGSIGDREYTANWSADTQKYYVDIYYMNTSGSYNTAPDETKEFSAKTDASVSFDHTVTDTDGFTFDAENSSLSGTIPQSGTLRLTVRYTRNRYDMVFHANGGSETATINAFYDAPVTEPEEPTRTAYTFNGWFTDNGTFADEYTFSTMPLEGIGLYAKWTADGYTLTFVENGGTAVDDIAYDTESTATLPAIKRTGWFFTGWKVTTAGGNWEADSIHTIGEAVTGKYGSATLTAQWTDVSYTLTFDGNVGTVSPASITYRIDNLNGYTLPLPVRAGYTFAGWKVTSVTADPKLPDDVTWTVGTVYENGMSLTDTCGNAEMQAQWTPNYYDVSVTTPHITYDGETGTDKARVDIDYTAALTAQTGYLLPATVTVTVGGVTMKDGVGYTYTVNTERTEATLTVNGAYIIGDITVAVTPELIVYTLTYDLADPKNLGRAAITGWTETYTIESDPVTLPQPTLTGYTFLGWTGTDVDENDKNVVIPTGSYGGRSYVAHWSADTQTYYIDTYLMNDSGTYEGVTASRQTLTAKTDDVVSCTMEDKTGFTANAGISTLSGTIPQTGNLVLVRKYDRNTYNLTLNTSEGISAVTGTNTYYYDKELSFDATVMLGYTWSGWYNTDDSLYTAAKNPTIRMPASDLTLTAKATEDVYNLTYDLADGHMKTGETNPDTYTVNSADITLKNPERTGYTFEGWTGTGLTGAQMTVTVENGSVGHRSYVATWKPITYSITYDLDDTAGAYRATLTGQKISYNIEDEDFILAEPTRSGYTFLGWTGSNGETAQKNVKIETGSYGDKSYKANWQADARKYTVNIYCMGTDGNYPTEPTEQYIRDAVTDENVHWTVTAKTGFTFEPSLSVISGDVPCDDSLVLTVRYSRNQYKLELATSEGIASVSGADTYYYDIDVTAAAVLMPGYRFVKWVSDDAAVLADSTDLSYGFKMPAHNAKLTATAEIITYDVTYDLAGGHMKTGETNPATYNVNTPTFTLYNPERTGYTFLGWTGTDTPTANRSVSVNQGSIGGRAFTANWQLNTYTISYDLDKGNLGEGESNPATYTYEDGDITLINPTRTGYDFIGWSGTDIDGTAMSVTIDHNSIGNRSYKANWQARTDIRYEIRYLLQDIGGGEHYTELLSARITAEATADTYVDAPVKTFTGFTSPSPMKAFVSPDGSCVFEYRYQRNIYTLTLHAFGVADRNIRYYFDEPIATPTEPVRTGYDFTGWNPALPATMPAGDREVTAQWSAVIYTVGYDLGGGTAAGNRTSYTVEDTFTLVNPTRRGYTFTGWSGTGLDGENNMTVSVPVGSTENRFYTAHWEINTYYITYDLAGGQLPEGLYNPVSYTVNDTFTLVEPERLGYEFNGWTGTGLSGTVKEVTLENAVGDRTYVAKWSPRRDMQYKVYHYQQNILDNGYTLKETETKYGVTNTTVSPSPKTYEGFRSPSRRSAVVLPDGSTVIEYYYTRNSYTITFDSNGGTTVAPVTYRYGQTIVPPYDPSYLGFSFVGWNPELPATMPAHDLRVTAQWTPNTDTPYTVLHYLQAEDCNSFPEELCETEYRYGQTGEIVTVPVRNYEGFTPPVVQETVISADGSRVVYYYYTRNSYTVTFNNWDDTFISSSTVPYGTPAEQPETPTRLPDENGHYVFECWSMDITAIHGDMTVTAQYVCKEHTPSGTNSCTEDIVCTECGYVITPAHGHKPVDTVPAVAPTCLTGGNSAESTCEYCGQVLSHYSVLPALGHDIGSWYVDVPATETETGLMKRACSRCDWCQTYIIPVLSEHPVTGIRITTRGSQGYIGGDYRLMTEITPSSAEHKEVLWESSDTDVASITQDGWVSSHKPGVVTFTVVTLDGQYTDSITVDFSYSAANYDIIVTDLFACNLTINGKKADLLSALRVKAGSDLTIEISPTVSTFTEYGYILSANGSNIDKGEDGKYHINGVYENINLTALPAVDNPEEFEDPQQYDTDDKPEQSIFEKIIAFFKKIAEWFANLFK